MNAFLSALEKYDVDSNSALRRGELTTIQVNMGNLCNQQCLHCHIEASPNGEKIMLKELVDDILGFLAKYKMQTLDITGGAPELNPNFDYFVKRARPLVDEIIIRSNLTVLFENDKEYLPEFFKENRVHLVCSLPCYLKENIEYQRGRGVFKKSITALRLLNKAGFSRKAGLDLDLVYNPMGAYLPPDQEKLQKDYKRVLKEQYGIDFNRLITITNVPIKRFREHLDLTGEYEKYFNLLKDNFNPRILNNLMCRTFLSVGFDGRVYDCDFNLALGFALKDASKKFLIIDKLNPEDLEGREIIIDEHCLSCAAGSGSSCQGALSGNNNKDSSSISCAVDTGKNKKKEVNPVRDKPPLDGCLLPLMSSDKSSASVSRDLTITDRRKVISNGVKSYYGKILQSANDLKTNACCASVSLPSAHRDILKKIEPEILDKFYGCGSPIPPLLTGKTILDLGCGTGRDVYLASFLAGRTGKAIGVDMTDEQLKIAKKYQDIQMRKFGLKKSNVEFKKGYIEYLQEIGIEDDSIDVVISNCVINLSPDKKSVFREIFRVLKPGGELYFSDVFSSSRIHDELRNDPVVYGECLGGALYIEDFRRILQSIGCPDYRVVSSRKLIIDNREIEEKIGLINFCSMTMRAFKLADLEDICEDYGQVAIYQGTIPEYPHRFKLDDHHIFIAKKPMLVCGNTASMLSNTRYAKHFQVIGARSIHFGPFQCGPASSKINNTEDNLGGSCC